MIIKKFLKSSWGKTFPIFLYFSLIIILFAKNIPLSDGIRYWKTASDILDGFQTTPVLDSWLLLNGPLYPLALAFFKAVGFSVKAAIFLNAVFLYLGFTFFFKTANLFFSSKKALWFTYILVVIDPFLFYWSTKLYSEPLSILFVCLLIYYLTLFNKNPKTKNLLKVAFIFSLIALTRVIFGYVLLTLFLAGLIFYLFTKKKVFMIIGSIGFYSIIFCIPYLIFTYSITKKVFYWSANGGDLLYWTSSPHETDLGEWHTLQINHDHFASRYKTFSGLDSLYLRKVNDVIINEINENHFEFAQSLSTTKNLVEYDDALKNKALENLANYPFSFLKNWILNSGRLLIGYPHALYFKPPYSPILSLLNILKSSFVLFAFLLSTLIFLLFLRSDKVTFILSLIALIYLAGQSLLAVQSQRFLLPLYPIMIFIFAKTFDTIKIHEKT